MSDRNSVRDLFPENDKDKSAESGRLGVPPLVVLEGGSPIQQLKIARERMGLSVGDVCSRLKMTPKQIYAMEAGSTSGLPPGGYARAFVKSYAKLLDLDPELIASTLLDGDESVTPEFQVEALFQERRPTIKPVSVSDDNAEDKDEGASGGFQSFDRPSSFSSTWLLSAVGVLGVVGALVYFAPNIKHSVQHWAQSFKEEPPAEVVQSMPPSGQNDAPQSIEPQPVQANEPVAQVTASELNQQQAMVAQPQPQIGQPVQQFEQRAPQPSTSVQSPVADVTNRIQPPVPAVPAPMAAPDRNATNRVESPSNTNLRTKDLAQQSPPLTKKQLDQLAKAGKPLPYNSRPSDPVAAVITNNSQPTRQAQPVVSAPVTQAQLQAVQPTTVYAPVLPTTTLSSQQNGSPASVAGRSGAPVTTQTVIAPQLGAPPAPSAQAAAPVLRMTFYERSWVTVRDKNGNVLISQMNDPGTEKVLEGNGPFKIILGNAGEVKLRHRGKVIDLQPYIREDVARLTVE